MIYDLHAHSNASDGILSPQALVSRAKDNGVDVLALTDHDTIAGIGAAREAAEACGVQLINGIELSAQWAGRGIHVVGLNIDCCRQDLIDAVDRQQGARLERAHLIGERLARAGVRGAFEGAQAHAEDSNIGRPHFAKFLVEAGYVNNFQAAFKTYLGAGKVGDVKQLWPGVEEVVGTITAAGGVAVLAHPLKYTMTRSRLCALLQEFRSSGGRAMEVISGSQTLQDTQNMAIIARQFGLYASIGSDFHAPDQPWHDLGRASHLPDGCEPVWQCWDSAA